MLELILLILIGIKLNMLNGLYLIVLVVDIVIHVIEFILDIVAVIIKKIMEE